MTKEKILKYFEFYGNRKAIMFARWLSVNHNDLPKKGSKADKWYLDKLKQYNEEILPNEKDIINSYSEFLIKNMYYE